MHSYLGRFEGAIRDDVIGLVRAVYTESNPRVDVIAGIFEVVNMCAWEWIF